LTTKGEEGKKGTFVVVSDHNRFRLQQKDFTGELAGSIVVTDNPITELL